MPCLTSPYGHLPHEIANAMCTAEAIQAGAGWHAGHAGDAVPGFPLWPPAR